MNTTRWFRGRPDDNGARRQDHLVGETVAIVLALLVLGWLWWK